MGSVHLITLVLALFAIGSYARQAPSVKTQNGSYTGMYHAKYDQDFFLGIPYAQAPVGDLRFRSPRALNDSWSVPRQATEYGASCIGYGPETIVLGDNLSEDCLTLNVVRPSRTLLDAKHPVAVWIHGGGLVSGGSADPRYNTSFIVKQSMDMETPIISVSVNYRLHAWGYLFGEALAAEQAGVLGFRDQRLALHWIKENIAAFGGDPDHVTIWGESSGACSVGAQLIAYGGRDDSLFSAAVMQSGVPLWQAPQGSPTVKDWEPFYQGIIGATNCTDAEDSLDCLRKVPTDDLSNIFSGPAGVSSHTWGDVVDGDFFEAPNREQYGQGNFVRVPILLGSNFDEGATAAPRGFNTTEEFLTLVSWTGVDEATAEELARLYPDDPAVGIPGTLEGRPTRDLASLGAQYKRVAAFFGDMLIHAPRRFVAEAWAQHRVPAYSYQWNVLVNGMGPEDGAGHFQEVAFVFNNIDGEGYDTPFSVNPFEGMPQTFPQLADLMSRMWIGFFAHRDPNFSKATTLKWPVYEMNTPQNFIFDANITGLAKIEADTYREEGIDTIIAKLYPIMNE